MLKLLELLDTLELFITGNAFVENSSELLKVYVEYIKTELVSSANYAYADKIKKEKGEQ